MVRMPIKQIDIKKMKMAKQVLAVFEILGIDEKDLDNLVAIETLRYEINELKSQIKELQEFKEKTIKAEKLEASGGKTTNAYSENLMKAFGGKTEEFNLNGKR